MTIQERVAQLAQQPSRDLGLDLVAVEWVREHGRRVLRVTIDKPAGISHDDCERMSRQLDAMLDQVDLITEPYHLEISSPGAERVLETPEDFRRFAGRRVLVRSRVPVDGCLEWRGNLVRATEEAIVVGATSGEVAVPRAGVTRVRLSIE